MAEFLGLQPSADQHFRHHCPYYFGPVVVLVVSLPDLDQPEAVKLVSSRSLAIRVHLLINSSKITGAMQWLCIAARALNRPHTALQYTVIGPPAEGDLTPTNQRPAFLAMLVGAKGLN